MSSGLILTYINITQEFCPLHVARKFGVGVMSGQYLESFVGQMLLYHAVKTATELTHTDGAVTERIKVLKELFHLKKKMI